ncbi:MAG: hypothetical protein JO235_01960 [Chroococcidiopsidaceae cyanobacterium CP_BM_RX_35]|nr:hypothetical protein [Chroococcidiopsidaceae cyanobacterium CP_BM_RX_35]
MRRCSGYVLCASNILYGDKLISATELNRRPGEVLDQALEGPVTITRGDRAFALLPREQMAAQNKATTQLKDVIEVINVAYRLRLGQNISAEHPYGWLKAFDTDELNELIVEILNAFRIGSDLGNWEPLETVIHEWHESAKAIDSLDLAEAFTANSDEVPLTKPPLECVSK